MNIKVKKLIAGCLAGLFLSGCATVGPKAIKQAHYPYNEAIIHSWKEQMLLNLVRLRYMDNPYFIEVNGLTSSYTLGLGLELGSRVFPFDRLETYHQAIPKLGYEEKPTITYAPLQGNEFVKQMLSPISPEFILILTQSGWGVQRVFDLCVQRVNDIYNAPEAAGPTPEHPPVFRKFDQFTKDLGMLQDANLIELGGDVDGSGLILEIKDHPDYLSTIADVYAALGVPENKQFLKLTTNSLSRHRGDFNVTTRSLMSVMFYLSHSVAVPPEHMAQGLVTITRNPDGSIFDWRKISGKEMVIRSSKSKPKCASVAVCYRGYWFFIADNDLNSKASFMLLSKLFNLQGGDPAIAIPTLTIPVS